MLTYLSEARAPPLPEGETSLLVATCQGRAGIHPKFAALELG